MPMNCVQFPRVVLSVLLLLLVFGLGLWAGGGRTTQRDPLTEFPTVVRIAHSEAGGPANGGIEVRDRQTISFLDALFPNYRKEAQAGSPNPPSDEHHVLEFTLERVGHAKRLFVWFEGDKEYWQAGRKRLSVQGSFRRFMAWLPVRRAIELANQPNADRSLCSQQLVEQHEQFLGIVIDNTRHQVGWLKFWVVRDLLTLLESVAPRTQHRTAGYPVYQRINGLIAGPLPESSPRLAEIREIALGSLQGDTERDASSILALTADEPTIDALARRLRAESDMQTNGELIVCLQSCLGLPAFERHLICGNSTPEEIEQFRKAEEKRTNEAKAALIAWYAVWKPQSPEQRHAAVVAAWDSEFVRVPHDHEHLFAELTRRYANLLRRGPAMLPAVESAQANSDLIRRGALETLKAYWTGRCDKAVVEELLKGNRRQQMLACDIIAAAGDASWKDQLTELIRAPRSPSEDLPLWAKLMEKAAETLVMCHDAEALPLLKEIDHHGFSTVRFALQHFQVPQGN